MVDAGGDEGRSLLQDHHPHQDGKGQVSASGNDNGQQRAPGDGLLGVLDIQHTTCDFTANGDLYTLPSAGD